MRVLVTGATGFLGRAVVNRLLEKGHEVRALVRPATNVSDVWTGPVEVLRCDLAEGSPGKLDVAFEDGIDAVVHLAAAVGGDEARQFATTVVGTERLLDAMSRSACRRVILASSFTVYDWDAARGTLTEDTPLTTDFEARGGYTWSKAWQERVARRLSDQHGFALTILRPGVIWGPGREVPAGLTVQVGSTHIVFGVRTCAPLTSLESCADSFVLAAERPDTEGQVFNVVDSHPVPTARFVRDQLRRTGVPGTVIAIPYRLGRAMTQAADLANRALFDGNGRLPSALVRARFVARFKPLRFSAAKLEAATGWRS